MHDRFDSPAQEQDTQHIGVAASFYQGQDRAHHQSMSQPIPLLQHNGQGQWFIIQEDSTAQGLPLLGATSVSGGHALQPNTPSSRGQYIQIPSRTSVDGYLGGPQLSTASSAAGSYSQRSVRLHDVQMHRARLEQQLLNLQLNDPGSQHSGMLPRGAQMDGLNLAPGSDLSCFLAQDGSVQDLIHTVALDSSNQALHQLDLTSSSGFGTLSATSDNALYAYTVASDPSGSSVYLPAQFRGWDDSQTLPAALQGHSAHTIAALSTTDSSMSQGQVGSATYTLSPMSAPSNIQSAPLPFHQLARLAPAAGAAGTTYMTSADGTVIPTSVKPASGSQLVASIVSPAAVAGAPPGAVFLTTASPMSTRGAAAPRAPLVATQIGAPQAAGLMPASSGVSSPLPLLSGAQYVPVRPQTAAPAEVPSRFRVLPAAVQQRIMLLCQHSHVVSVRDFDEKVVSKLCLLVDAHGVEETLAMLNHLEHRMRSKQGPMRNGPGYLDVAVCSHMDMLKAQGLCPKDMKLDEYAKQVLDPQTYEELLKCIEGNKWLSWELLDEGVVQLLNRLPVAAAVEKLQEIGAHSFKNVDNIKGCIISVLNTKIREDRRVALR